MHDQRRRLHLIYSRLSAQERAVLVLHALKEDAPEPLLVRRTMPVSQLKEFNRLVRTMNAVNGPLGHYIIVADIRLEHLSQELSGSSTGCALRQSPTRRDSFSGTT